MTTLTDFWKRPRLAAWAMIVCGVASVIGRASGAEPLSEAPRTTTAEPQLVSFPSGNLALHGFLYLPAGEGPFPAVIWNHGSEKLPGSRPELARFYTRQGFVFFVPHRHGHGHSPGEYIGDLQTKARAAAKDDSEYQREVIQLHELYLKDTVAAVNWLRQRLWVDTNRMVMSGVSYGGIQTLLAAEMDLPIKAYVPFAPGAMSWQRVPQLRERLLQAVKQAHAPIFLLQATNDYDLGPSEALGRELKRKGGLNRTRIYPAFGDSQQSGHGAFATQGTSVWGPDVLAFLDQVLEPRTAPASGVKK